MAAQKRQRAPCHLPPVFRPKSFNRANVSVPLGSVLDECIGDFCTNGGNRRQYDGQRSARIIVIFADQAPRNMCETIAGGTTVQQKAANRSME
jgi:hypothetical protein